MPPYEYDIESALANSPDLRIKSPIYKSRSNSEQKSANR